MCDMMGETLASRDIDTIRAGMFSLLGYIRGGGMADFAFNYLLMGETFRSM